MKKLAIKTLVFILVCGAIVAAVAGYTYYKSDSYNTSRLSIMARFDRVACSDGRPISVNVANRGNRTLEYVYFRVQGREAGRSGIRVQEEIRSDFIVAPGETHSSCWQTRLTDTHTVYQLQSYVWEVGSGVSARFD